jgi:copper chaperone CopZ
MTAGRRSHRALGLWSLVILLAVTADAPAQETATTVLTIKGMTCGGCVASVKIQLRKTEGVTAYEVSYEKAEAQVTYEPAKTTPEKIAASVSKTGFTASVKPKTDQKASAEGSCEGGACQRDCCKEAARAAKVEQAPEADGLVSLAQDTARLQADFNAAKSRHRFVAVLSPTCGACVHGAEAIKAAVLPVASSVPVFVVWAPMLAADGGAEASAGARSLTAPGVRQYWDPSRRVGTSLRRDIFPRAVEEMKRSLPKEHYFDQYLVDRDAAQPEWDIYLLFAPGVEWTDRMPAPARWVRQTALFAKGEGGAMTSLLWANNYAAAPVEGDLREHLRALVDRSSAISTVR